MSSSHTWEARMWSAIAGPGPVRASVLLSWVLTEAWGQTCRAPQWACSVSSQSDPFRKRVRTCRTRGVQMGVGSRHPRPYLVHGVRMDTLVHSDATAACIVMEGNGRAEGPEKEDECRREEEEMCIPQLALHCNTSLPDVA